MAGFDEVFFGFWADFIAGGDAAEGGWSTVIGVALADGGCWDAGGFCDVLFHTRIFGRLQQFEACVYMLFESL